MAEIVKLLPGAPVVIVGMELVECSSVELLMDLFPGSLRVVLVFVDLFWT